MGCPLFGLGFQTVLAVSGCLSNRPRQPETLFKRQQRLFVCLIKRYRLL
ncbi:hypothetical protein [Kingella oralis]|nr:hypothetical protein [Kingella oralis]